MPVVTKHCNKCNRDLPADLEHFNRRRASRRDGLMPCCKDCDRGRNKAYVHRVVAEAVQAEFDDGSPVFDRDLTGKRRFIVTAAQNNTPARADALAAARVASQYFDAPILCVPFRYKNPTGRDPGKDMRECGKTLEAKALRGDGVVACKREPNHKGDCSPTPDEVDELWWDPALKDTLINTRKKLGPGLVLAADVKISPTASSPLSGFEALTGLDSCVIGHPKLQLLSIAVPVGCDPKILTTTGVITEKNYSNTKAGALGEFHYTLGALLVEVDEDQCHIRQLGMSKHDGSFTDLDLHFTGMGVTTAPPALAFITGDVHVDLTDPEVLRATFGAGGMVEVLRPRVWVAHDVSDGGSHNPHERGNLFLAEARRRADRSDIRAELQRVANFLNEQGKAVEEVVVVDSNHHHFLRRWVIECARNGCHDAKNAGVFFESGLYMWETAAFKAGGPEHGDPFHYWMRKLGVHPNVRCLEKDERFEVAGISLNNHGHNGPNGSRGTRKNNARTGVRSFIGHGHAEGIEEGCWSVGTLTNRRQAYHEGAGNNTNTNGVIYATGKRCLLTVLRRGRWRGEPLPRPAAVAA